MIDDVTYDSDTGQYHAEFARDEPDSIPDTVVFGLAAITDQDPIDLSPLGDFVDPDALGAIFRPAIGSDHSVSITFEYCDCVVTVCDDGRITFEEGD